MAAEIVLQIRSEFDDSGIQKAINQLNRLIGGATGKSSGKNLKSGLDSASGSSKELANSLEALNRIQRQVDASTRRITDSTRNLTEAQRRAQQVQRMARREQDFVNEIMEENADLMQRVRRVTGQLTKDTEKRAAAEKELRTIAQQANQLQRRRVELEERMQQAIARGNASAAEKKAMMRELNSLESQYTRLVNQRAAAERRLDDASDVRRQASAVRAELKHLMDVEDLTGTRQFEQMLGRIDRALDKAFDNGKAKVREFSTEFDKAGNKLVKFRDVYNRLGNTNLGSLLSRSGAHLEALGSNLDNTRKKMDSFSDEVKASSRQIQRDFETMTNAIVQSESKLFKSTSGTLRNTLSQLSRQQSQAVRESTRQIQAAIRQQQGILRSAHSGWNSLMQTLQRFANVAGGVAVNALNRLSGALSRVMSAGGRFASMRSALDATGRSFLLFGAQAERGAERAARAMTGIDRTFAGYSLLQTGQVMNQIARGMWMHGERAIGGYLDFERAATLAAVATVDSEADWLAGRSPTRFIQELVFGAQRGQFGAPIKTLSSQELAQGIYYYGSAIGQDITPYNADAVMRAIVPIMQVAGFTQTSPETMVKGVLNAAQQFGFDPRDVRNTQNVARIADLFGFLANATSMEVADIGNFFKMVGPLAHVLSPKGVGGSLEEIMAWAYIASDYGLRGSQPARGLQQLLQSVIDPTGPANKAAMELWGMGMREKFFDPRTGTIKGGLVGLIEPFLELSEGEWITAQAEMFTNNASRVIIPLIQAMRDNPDRWMEVINEIQQGNFLERGMITANNTLSAQLQDVKNAWTEFISTLMHTSQPEIFGFLGGLAHGIREVVDIINMMPQLGKTFTGLYAGIMSFVAAGGALLSFAGAMLILQRAMMLTGNGASIFLASLRAIPAVLAMGLPILAALAAAILALKVAWDNNFLGMRDGVEWLRDTFTGDFSTKFAQFLDSDRFKTAYTWATRLGRSFRELISGILFDVGDTNNLFAMMDHVFGPRLGTLINQNLDRLRSKLSDLRGSIRDFFSGFGEGLPTLREFGNAAIGVLESIFTRGMSGRGHAGLTAIGEWLGIDNLPSLVSQFATRFNQGFRTVTGYARSFVSQMRGILGQIGDNLGRIFTFDNLMTGLRALMSFAAGFGSAVAGSFMTAARAVELFTRALANAGRAGEFANNIIESLVGVRLELNNVAAMVGMVFGSLFASRVLMAVTPLRLVTTSLTGLGVSLALITTRVAMFGAQLSLLAARAAAVAAIGAIFRTVALSVSLLAAAAGVGSAAMVGFVGVIGGLNATLLGIVGLLGVVAVGIYAFVAATQGFAQANALARAFFDGLVQGASIAIAAVRGLLNALLLIGGAVLKFADWAAGLVGIETGFRNAENAAVAFGIAVGMVATASVVAAVANIMKSLMGLTLGFGRVRLAAPLAFGAIGLALLATGPQFETVIGWIDTLIAKLNEASIAGIGLGDILLGAGVVGSTSAGRSMMRRIATHPLARGVASRVSLPAAVITAGWYGTEMIDDWMTRTMTYSDLAEERRFAGQSANQHFVPILLNEWEQWKNDQAVMMFGPNYTYSQYQRMHNSPQGQLRQAKFIREQQVAFAFQTGTNPQLEYFDFAARGSLEGFDPNRHTLAKLPHASLLQAIAMERDEGVPSVYSFQIPQAGDIKPSSVVKSGGISVESDIAKAQKESQSLLAQLTQKDGVIDFVSDVFGVSSSSFMRWFGFTPDGGFSLDALFDESGLGKFKGKWDETMLDFLPQPLKQYMEDAADWERWERTVKSTGSVEAAREIFNANQWRIPTQRPRSFGSYLDSIGMTEEEFEMLSMMEQQNYEAFMQHQQDVMQAWHQADIPSAMQAVFSPSYRTPQGNLGRTVSGAEALMTYADQFLQNFGESMPWMNQQEILADAGIAGILTQNLAGINMHKALAPVAEKWAMESGLTVEEIMNQIPKFFHDPKYMTQATTDLAQFFASVPRNSLAVLDTLGMGEFEEFGLKWQELTQYAVSQAMAGNTDWNLADYISQAWDMSKADAEAYIRANGLDPNVITGAMFADTQGMVNSMGGEIVALTTEWWDYLNGVTQNGADKTIEITQEAFNALPDYVKMAYNQMGYQFVIGGEMTAQQAAATVKMMENRLTAAYGETFTAIQDEIKAGTEDVIRYTDEFGTEWVSIMDDVTGKRYSIPAVEYEAYKSSLEEAERAARDFAEGFRQAWDDAIKAAEQARLGDGTAGPLMPTEAYGIGMGAGLDYFFKQGGGKSSATSPLTEALQLEGVKLEVATVISEGVAQGIADADFQQTFDAAVANVDLKLKMEIDTPHFASSLQEIIANMGSLTNTAKFKLKMEIDTAYFADSLQSLIANMGSLSNTAKFKLKMEIDTAHFADSLQNVIANMGSLVNTANFKLKMEVDTEHFAGSVQDIIANLGSLSSTANFKIKVEADGAAFAESVQAMIASLGSISETANFKLRVTVDFAEASSQLVGFQTVVSGMEFKATLGADLSQLGSDIGAATSLGGQFAALTFTATLDGDMGPFGTTVADAINLGGQFQALTFIAKLGGNAGAFLNAVLNATAVGQAFASRTFMATISANTAPFAAAVAMINGSTVGTAYINVVARNLATVNAGASLGGRFAEGGRVLTRDKVLVGEKGPELVTLPYGSYVHTNAESQRMVAEWAEALNVGTRTYGSSPMTSTTRTGVTPSQAQSLTVRYEPTGGATKTNTPEQVILNFHGPVYMRDENEFKRATKEIVAEVKREIARDHELAERGMTSVPIGRTLG